MSTARRVLVLGATSAIAQAVARVYAAGGARLALVARSRDHLATVADDLAVRGAEVVLQRTVDLCQLERHRRLVAEAEQALDGLDVVLVAHGVLPDQKACQDDPRRAVASWDVNFASAATLMEAAAERMAVAGHGTIGAISSVAGDRGRADNYVYGAAKAALTAYAGGLGHRLRGTGVTVVTIKPGPVDTPMIAGRKLSPRLVADVDVAGRRIHRALERGERVVYVPGKWRWIMAVIRALPVRVFERLEV
ncbi:MAG TPA: SDR family oxidoreductase [Myxococcaceae bacterium]|nr:SDR family oxidoreductase [Myxococcaceae bacterium]